MTQGRPRTRVSVLIADDDAVTIGVLRALVDGEADLSLVGTARSAPEAISLGARTRPDVAVLDVAMPGGGGAAAARELARVSPATRVIALSASEDVPTVRQMLRAGAVGYSVKGTPDHELLDQIRAAASAPTRLPKGDRPDRVTVLVACDDVVALEILADSAEADPGVEIVGLAQTAHHAVSLAARLEPTVALVDATMAGGVGRLAAEIQAVSPGTRVVSHARDARPDAVLAGVLGHDLLHLAPEEHHQLRQSRLERVRAALEQETLDIALQPIRHLDDGAQIAGYEALARFPAAPPNVWFDDAHRVGLGVDLELLAVRRALGRLAELPAGAWLSINASPVTIITPAFAAVVAEEGQGRVVVEITEHASVDDYDTLGGALRALRGAGVRVAVDDCGAGFSSLRHVMLVAPEFLKLDTSMCRELAHPVRAAMARALVGFARETGAQAVAEGIEHERDLDALRALGVPFGQGWLLGMPERANAPLAA